MNPRVVPVLHVAFIGGVVSVFVVLAFVRDLADMTAPVLPLVYARIGAAALAAAAVVARRVVRASVRPCGPDDDPRHWWAANIGRVIVIWALADGLAMMGAVLWFLTGDLVTLAIAGGSGLFLLAVTHPGTLVHR